MARDTYDPIRSDRKSKYVIWGAEMGQFKILKERWGWRIVREITSGHTCQYMQCVKITLIGM